MQDTLYLVLAFLVLGNWIYLFYVYFQNHKNGIQVIMGVTAAVFWLLFLVNSIRVMSALGI